MQCEITGGEMSILTVIDDLPVVFPCFSKDLDSFLCDTIYEGKEEDMRQADTLIQKTRL